MAHKEDSDIAVMTRDQLRRELTLVRKAIRIHRDAALTGRRLDDDKLYEDTLPEGSDACHIRDRIKHRNTDKRLMAKYGERAIIGNRTDDQGKVVTISHLRLMPPPKTRSRRQGNKEDNE